MIGYLVSFVIGWGVAHVDAARWSALAETIKDWMRPNV